MFFCGIAVSLVTLIVTPDSRIVFGILTFLGSAMLVMIFLEKVLCKINSIIGAVISYVLFEFTFKCNIGYLGFFGMNLIELPDSLFANYFTAFWGFPNKQFYSSDYFSLFPWLFLFIFGYFLYNIF